eukprot:3278139-Rhodomonas_salina.1
MAIAAPASVDKTLKMIKKADEIAASETSAEPNTRSDERAQSASEIEREMREERFEAQWQDYHHQRPSERLQTGPGQLQERMKDTFQERGNETGPDKETSPQPQPEAGTKTNATCKLRKGGSRKLDSLMKHALQLRRERESASKAAIRAPLQAIREASLSKSPQRSIQGDSKSLGSENHGVTHGAVIESTLLISSPKNTIAHLTKVDSDAPTAEKARSEAAYRPAVHIPKLTLPPSGENFAFRKGESNQPVDEREEETATPTRKRINLGDPDVLASPISLSGSAMQGLSESKRTSTRSATSKRLGILGLQVVSGKQGRVTRKVADVDLELPTQGSSSPVQVHNSLPHPPSVPQKVTSDLTPLPSASNSPAPELAEGSSQSSRAAKHSMESRRIQRRSDDNHAVVQDDEPEKAAVPVDSNIVELTDSAKTNLQPSFSHVKPSLPQTEHVRTRSGSEDLKVRGGELEWEEEEDRARATEDGSTQAGKDGSQSPLIDAEELQACNAPDAMHTSWKPQKKEKQTSWRGKRGSIEALVDMQIVSSLLRSTTSSSDLLMAADESDRTLTVSGHGPSSVGSTAVSPAIHSSRSPASSPMMTWMPHSATSPMLLPQSTESDAFLHTATTTLSQDHASPSLKPRSEGTISALTRQRDQGFESVDPSPHSEPCSQGTTHALPHPTQLPSIPSVDSSSSEEAADLTESRASESAKRKADPPLSGDSAVRPLAASPSGGRTHVPKLALPRPDTDLTENENEKDAEAWQRACMLRGASGIIGDGGSSEYNTETSQRSSGTSTIRAQSDASVDSEILFRGMPSTRSLRLHSDSASAPASLAARTD